MNPGTLIALKQNLKSLRLSIMGQEIEATVRHAKEGGIGHDELLIANRDLKLARVLKKISKYRALIIDDIGYVQQSREEMEVLFTLLADRYERGSVMLTSNLPFSKWEQIFKDPMTDNCGSHRQVGAPQHNH